MAVLTGVVYAIARNTIEDEINDSNRLLLESIRDNIDRSLSAINDLSLEVLASPEIQEISTLIDGDEGLNYKLYKAAQDLNDYKIFREGVKNFYIYLGGINRVIWPRTVTPARFYYNNYINNEYVGYDQWKQLIDQWYYGEFVKLPFYDSDSKNDIALAFVRSIPYPVMGDHVTSIVIITNFDEILNMDHRETRIAILDGNNQVVAQNNADVVLNSVELPEMPGIHGMFKHNSEGKKEIISYITSRKYNWKYITITPERVFWERSLFIRIIMWGELFLCMVGMGFISFYFVRRNYNVLSEITSFIRSKLKSDLVYDANEYNLIRQALRQSIDEKDEVRSMFDEQQQVLRNNLLIGLMEGNEMPVPLNELLASYNVSFPHRYYCVVSVYIKRVNNVLWGGEKYNLAKIAVIKLLEKILDRNNTAYTIDYRGHIFVIINTPLGWQEFHKALDEDLRKARDIINQDLDIDVYIAVGGVYNASLDIRRSYNESLSSMDYARVLDKGNIIYFWSIGKENKKTGLYPFQKEQILLNHLHLSDKVAIKEEINDLFYNGFLNTSASQETVRFMIFALTFNLLRNCCADEEEFNKYLDESRNSIELLTMSKTVIEMKEPLILLLDNVINHRTVSRDMKKLFSSTVQEYVVKHYTDPMLCIETIADAMGKTPYYASKKFKIETGGGILDFIYKIRIDNAKELMKDVSLTQAQIAEKSGFTSVRTYHRIFKKMEGVTPGQYKYVE
jgi:AraC-like DNA-binding protein